MQVSWFCNVAGRVLGPFSAQQLVDMARNDKLHPTDLVRRHDSKWVPAQNVKGLFRGDSQTAGRSGVLSSGKPVIKPPPGSRVVDPPASPPGPLPDSRPAVREQVLNQAPKPAPALNEPPKPGAAVAKPTPLPATPPTRPVETPDATAVWTIHDSPTPAPNANLLRETTAIWAPMEPLTPSPEDNVLGELAESNEMTVPNQGSATRIVRGLAPGAFMGNYIILDVLGEGGMGTVLKAQHIRMERLVALKVLRSDATKSQSTVRRFHQEVKAAARLSHPNIVTAYDADEVKGAHFLVMEYVQGVALSDLVAQQGQLPVKDALNYVLQTARGLDYAHSEGVVHRDIKPANLLLDRRGTVKILDMGLASIKETTTEIDEEQAPKAEGNEPVTQADQLLGTFDYMSPEQAEDPRSVDHRTDIYSLGCTLFRLLTGRLPYGGSSPMKKIFAHREHPIPPLGRKDVPFDVDNIFRHMVAKKPGERYQTMSAVIADIEAVLAGRSINPSGGGSLMGGDSAGHAAFVPRPEARLDAIAPLILPTGTDDGADAIRFAPDDFPKLAGVGGGGKGEPMDLPERWYWKVMGEEMGPLNLKQLKRKKITPDDMVRRDNSDVWFRASEIKDLF